MNDEPKPMPTMGDALKGMFARLAHLPSRVEYGDNGVIGWFLGMEADNKDLRARVAELTEDKSEASPCNECTLNARVAELEAENASPKRETDLRKCRALILNCDTTIDEMGEDEFRQTYGK